MAAQAQSIFNGKLGHLHEQLKMNTDENPSLSPALARPNPPSALFLVSTSETSIKITWGYSAGGGETGTRVKWGTDPSQDNTIGEENLPLSLKTFVIPELKPATKYFIFVYGTAGEEVSHARQVEGTTKPATALPGKPTNLQASSSKSTVLLTWDKIDNASSYKIAYGIEGGPVLDNPTSTNPTINITGLISNTRYFFKVVSTNNNGDSASTDIVKQTLKVPAAPTNLTATPQVTTMDLSWDIPQDAVTFYVCHGLEPGGAAQCIESRPPRYTLTGLTKNTLYYVEVVAEGLNGGSMPARITQKTLDGPPIPSRPGALHTLVTFDKVRVTWGGPQAPNYELAYGLVDKYPEVIGKQTTAYLTDTIKYLAPDTRYFIEVRGFNASGYSEPSSTEVTTGPNMTQPRGVHNPGRTFSEAWLKWERPEDHSYLIDYEITCPERQPVRTTALEHIFTDLIPAKEYTFKIQPRRIEGAPPALAASIQVVTHDRVPPTRPGNLKLTASTQGNATLDWRASEDNVGVTGYQVRRNDGDWVAVSGTSHPVTGLIDGVVERFEVRARDAAGNWSIPAGVSSK